MLQIEPRESMIFIFDLMFDFLVRGICQVLLGSCIGFHLGSLMYRTRSSAPMMKDFEFIRLKHVHRKDAISQAISKIICRMKSV